MEKKVGRKPVPVGEYGNQRPQEDSVSWVSWEIKQSSLAYYTLKGEWGKKTGCKAFVGC